MVEHSRYHGWNASDHVYSYVVTPPDGRKRFNLSDVPDHLLVSSGPATKPFKAASDGTSKAAVYRRERRAKRQAA